MEMTVLLTRFLALVSIVCAIGCGEGSSQGMTWHLVLYGPHPTSAAEKMEQAHLKVQAVPRGLQGVKRFEWGPLTKSTGPEFSHCLLVTLGEPTSMSEWSDIIRDSSQEGYRVRALECKDIHDLTPHVRTSSHGRLRRVMLHTYKPGEPESNRNFDDALAALPSKVPEIERLQWAIQPPPNNMRCIVMTFKDPTARDTALGNKAYKEFQELRPTKAIYEYIVK